MHSIIKTITSKATEASEVLNQLKDAGLKSVSEVIGKTRLCGALTADEEDTTYDETHYFFVPVAGASGNNAIYTKRVLPPNVGAENSLPKLRIFHLPDESSAPKLEEKLSSEIVQRKSTEPKGASNIADLLETVAQVIDQKTQKASGGLLIVGGVVAIVNPIAGVGIVTKALLPSVGSHITKHGASFIGNKLRARNQSNHRQKVEKEATSEVKKLKPVIYQNALLQSLDAIATNPCEGFDPALEKNNWSDNFSPNYYYTITLEAISEVYAAESPDLSGLTPAHRSWINSLISSSES